MCSTSMWFALVAALEPKWAFTGTGVKPNMSFGVGDLFTFKSLDLGSGHFLKIPKKIYAMEKCYHMQNVQFWRAVINSVSAIIWIKSATELVNNISIWKPSYEVVKSMSSWMEYNHNTVSFRHYKRTKKGVGIKASKLYQQNKREVMLQESRRYPLSPLLVIPDCFPKKESCWKKKLPWIPVNASENQASYSCCQLI